MCGDEKRHGQPLLQALHRSGRAHRSPSTFPVKETKQQECEAPAFAFLITKLPFPLPGRITSW